ncbi:DUF3810 domain-containing protein [uncultured Winogradskyella sp.]|uniref:DUF3810 domain-containing protein n=1 Tax=uncultured Winogradskyella sp. TaxID=395353 RepID=UPI00260EC8E9|nr:DUF3810 domain-containing protein [uncultured Winogradskyella sp.]
MLKNKKLVITLFLSVQILLISILKNYPEFVEQFYSNGLYLFISKLMRYVFGWLPISIGDILYTLAGIYIIRWLIINRKRIIKDTKNWLLDVSATLSIAYLAFHMLWALNYYRQPLYKSLQLKADYSTEQLIDFTKRLVETSNKIHQQLVVNDTIKIEIPYTKSEVFSKVKTGYDHLAKTYPQLKYKPESIKNSIYSTPLTYMGFAGYFNPFTNEAQVDALIPRYKFITTSCHEVAHQLGYAAENEANFIGCLAAISNEDLYFKYSGYTFGLRHCLVELYRRDQDVYEDILATINKGILKNYEDVALFWKSYENPLEPIFEKTFDNFLKVNNQSAGMKSYSYVVALLVNYYNNKPL